jgi:hypothetical protein
MKEHCFVSLLYFHYVNTENVSMWTRSFTVYREKWISLKICKIFQASLEDFQEDNTVKTHVGVLLCVPNRI